jgi:hypothetical protein
MTEEQTRAMLLWFKALPPSGTAVDFAVLEAEFMRFLSPEEQSRGWSPGPSDA